MLKTGWLVLLVIAIGAMGGWYYYAHQQEGSLSTGAGGPAAQIVVITPRPSDDEIKRKSLEGIGSIKDLKPVPLDPQKAGDSQGK